MQSKKNANRVQEKEKSDLYPVLAQSQTKTGYRKRKRAICTRFWHKIRQKPVTEERKVPSVPVQCMKNERNRVQGREKSNLYPTKKKRGRRS